MKTADRLVDRETLLGELASDTSDKPQTPLMPVDAGTETKILREPRVRIPTPSHRPGDARTENTYEFSLKPSARPYISVVDGPYKELNAGGNLVAVSPTILGRLHPETSILFSLLGECRMLCKTLLAQKYLGKDAAGVRELLTYIDCAMKETMHASNVMENSDNYKRSLERYLEHSRERLEELEKSMSQEYVANYSI